MRSLLPVIVAAVLFAQIARGQNLLTNGSFESPDVAAGTAQVFTTPGDVPGWTDDSGVCGIEIQDHCCGTPIDGAQFMEVDSDCPAVVRQTVATQPGASYVITFDYSPRPGPSLGNPFDSAVDVIWNGATIDTLIGIAVGDTDWTPHAYSVTATGTTSTIEFTESGGANPTDSTGGYIDHVPEPGRSAQLVAGLALLAGLDLSRRRRSRSRPGGRSR
jgi:hypothetical protein